jgi:predicted CoA-substrate-specific enzyme activase
MSEKALGVCLGASSLKIAELTCENGKLKTTATFSKLHYGNIKEILLEEITNLDLKKYTYLTVTGRKFRNLLNFPSISEPEATEYALNFIPKAQTKYQILLSLGGENFVLYLLSEEGKILDVQTGNKCASGTGEFFLQQLGRMNISLDEALKIASSALPYKLSGRCSVFCKSDCTHALNKGVPIANVCSGLGEMISQKVVELFQALPKKNVIVVGGVTQNKIVMEYLKKEIENLFIPSEANFFEALGSAFYAFKNKIKAPPKVELIKKATSFHFLPPLRHAQDKVIFKGLQKGIPQEGDECIIGLDVGSTTTKAVLVRERDEQILASVYLRTQGQPVEASRECYRKLSSQLKVKVKIIGLGVTGSGRQIAGLHSLTTGIINEIIAHATAAAYFDKEVDTIFEIGGQDAKYTYLTAGVPSDYAMNEACSAGTGSFLEEAAKESLKVNYLEIEKLALRSETPPNFNDQCAAFINSDIKNATSENVKKEDIVGGLVYSICMNYINRVKGLRPVGEKIFMQGGVCYNKAVPLAMAHLIKKKIIVPPEPGLMGAFGVALEIKRRLKLGLLPRGNFNLEELARREIKYGKTFKCRGKKENCDRGCEINILIINNQKFPFGGVCNKYYNLRHNISVNSAELNFVRKRQEGVFSKFLIPPPQRTRGTVGITRAFLTNTLYPLYHNFFAFLGFTPLLSEQVEEEGIKRARAALCFPGQLAHGFFLNLVNQKPLYIFLPHVKELYIEGSWSKGRERQCTCILLQAEPYYIKPAFRREINSHLLTPILNFRQGWKFAKREFTAMAHFLKVKKKEAENAFEFALSKQEEFFRERRKLGEEVLHKLKNEPSRIAIVLFGRAYNAFAEEANLGIPDKLASRGVLVIPYDFLNFAHEPGSENMCWALGQEIIKAARYVKKHPQLFGVYITNFSCGPDSFLLTYFREIMGRKPSLTLELDSHTADVGVNTRVEAFLDIVERYRKLNLPSEPENKFRKAEIVFEKGKLFYKTSQGEKYPLKHNKRIRIIFPAMGKLSTQAIAATLRGFGYQAEALPIPTFETLIIGRGNTSCKECLPLILTVGSLVEYLTKHRQPDEAIAYFMPTGSGNCRFAQYKVFIKHLIEKKRFQDVALLTLTSENSYAGLGARDSAKILLSLITADVMEDIKNALLVLAQDKETALATFERVWQKFLYSLSQPWRKIFKTLQEITHELKSIPLNFPLEEAKKVLLLGEIFVRREEFSCQNLIDKLSQRQIIIKRAPVLEWLYYIDYLVKHNLVEHRFTLREKSEFLFKIFIQRWLERKVKRILATSGLYHYHLINMNKLIKYGEHFLSRELTGEPILVLGSFFEEIIDAVHGVISIGPFACLPSRIVEAILSYESTLENKLALTKCSFSSKSLKGISHLPFLALESDGNPFPQIVEARLDAFILRVERLFEKVNAQR